MQIKDLQLNLIGLHFYQYKIIDKYFIKQILTCLKILKHDFDCRCLPLILILKHIFVPFFPTFILFSISGFKYALFQKT